MASVAYTRQFVDACLHKPVGGEHVDDFGRAWITNGTTVADEEHGIAIDGQVGVIDAVVIVFWAVEDNGGAFPGVFVVWALEIFFIKVFVDDGCF